MNTKVNFVYGQYNGLQSGDCIMSSGRYFVLPIHIRQSAHAFTCLDTTTAEHVATQHSYHSDGRDTARCDITNFIMIHCNMWFFCPATMQCYQHKLLLSRDFRS